MNTLLYELLMKMTKFVVGVEVVDTVVELDERGKAGKAVKKVQGVVEKILEIALTLGWVSFLITITGGLYLFWLVFKLVRKNRKVKHDKSHKRA